MSFPDRAKSLRAKAHLSGVKLPVLVGVTALALVVLVAAGAFLLNTVAGSAFSVEKASDAETEQQEVAEVLAKTVIVHVGGAVVEPGVRELEEGARVQDAIEAAGGFAEGAARDSLNLARMLADGEQVVVPLQLSDEEIAAAASGAEGSGVPVAGARPNGKVNINTASVSELDALPGVGPSTAEKIVTEREANGPFATAEDLKRVSGIGDKKYAALADAICVG